MKSQKYLVAVDLDDTSLQNLHNLNEVTEKALKRVAALGHKVMISTARPACLTRPHYRKLELDTLAALCNGADLVNLSDDSFNVHKKYIPSSDVEKILDILPIGAVDSFYLERNDELYIAGEMKTSSYFKELAKQSEVKLVGLNKIPLIDAGRLFIWVKDIPDASKMMDKLMSIKSIDVYSKKWPKDSGKLYVSIKSILADKWYSVKEAADYYGITKENIITFGDEYNDSMMIKEAGTGFAMLNGSEELKAEVANVTRYSNTDGGVGRELDRLFNLDFSA